MFRTVFLVALLFGAAPAFAHVTANPDTAVAGQYFETKFRLSHGCGGSPTKSVTIKFPKGLTTVKPQHKEGWTVSIRKSRLDKPVPAGHGEMADEQFDDVTWSGGTLPDDQYDEFGLFLKLPAASGQTLWFPVKQVCDKSESNWNEIPAAGQEWHDMKSPAPFIKLTPPPAMDHSQHH